MVWVSVIIATRNGGRTIRRALASVVAQGVADMEIVVVDDGSDSCDIGLLCRDYLESGIMRLFRNKTAMGPGPARNLAVKESRGEYIAVIDDDDEWPDRGKLAHQLVFLDENHHHVLAGVANIEVVDEQGTLLYCYHYPEADDEIRQLMLARNCFVHSAVVFKKEAFEQLGGYRQQYLAEDYDLWLRMGKIGEMANLSGTRVRWTLCRHSTSSLYRTRLNIATMKIIHGYRKAYPGYSAALVRGGARLLWGLLSPSTPPYALGRGKNMNNVVGR